jgi:AbrB family looped-hinge helix DNA binding protein
MSNALVRDLDQGWNPFTFFPSEPADGEAPKAGVERHQISIPLEIRRKLGIKTGQELDIARVDGQSVLIVNPLVELRQSWRGKFKAGEATDDYLDQVRGEVS